MQKEKDLVFIRHSQSTFNLGTLQAIEKLTLGSVTWYDCLKNQQFNKIVTYNEKHIDADITEEGQKQAIDLNKKFIEKTGENLQVPFNILDVDLVLVSPYFRALRTCELIFQGSQAPVIVEPLVSQIFRYACDVPGVLEQKRQRFPQYDFSKIQSEHYFLQIFPKEQQKRIEEAFEKHEAKGIKDKQSVILKMMAEGSLIEHATWMRQRASKVKNLLQQYKKQHQTIAIVAHNYTLEFVRSKGFNQNGQLIQEQGIKNCHPYFQSLQQIIKIR